METQTPQETNTYASKKTLLFLGGILLLGAIIFGGLAAVKTINENNNSDDAVQEENQGYGINKSIIYGTWTQSNAAILLFDMSTGKEHQLATLPNAIRKITTLDQDNLLFINDTNVRDSGTELAQYTISSKTQKPVYTASDEFSIDEYVISPDRKMIAVWEVQYSEDSGTLSNGRAKVYTANLGQTAKNLIYDENIVANTPIHFPLSITNDGTVFSDKVIPNSAAGWAYGMSTSNFTGTDKQDIESMQNGTYSMYPLPSPDGKYFAFGGYDGTFGPGTETTDGFRKALTHTNTIEYLDINTLERKKIPNTSPTTRYGSSVKWTDTSTFTYDSFGDPSGEYIYTIPQQQSIIQQDEITKRTLAQFSNASLVGTPVETATALGSLGNNYELSYSALELHSSQSNTKKLPVSPALIQFISVVDSDYFDVSSLQSVKETSETTSQQLQLQTFVTKPKLYENRRETINEIPPPTTVFPTQAPRPDTGSPPPLPPPPSQNTPIVKCESLAKQKCSSLIVGNDSSCDNLTSQECIDHVASKKKYDSCYASEVYSQKSVGACVTHPLYLYGKEGMQVDVSIHTPIFNSNISDSGKYSFTLGVDGNFYHEGSLYTSLNYDYTSAIKRLPVLNEGYIVSNHEVKDAVQMMAKQFGLNEKETSDTVRDISSKVTADYVFISFYDQDTSHAIHPVTFDPEPDVYRNIIFFVKNLDTKPPFSVKAPKIEPIYRDGFTAIEIANIIE